MGPIFFRVLYPGTENLMKYPPLVWSKSLVEHNSCGMNQSLFDFSISSICLSYAPVIVNPKRGGGDQGQPRGFCQLSDIPPRRLWQWCSDPGAVLAFKIKIFPPPMIGNRGDSDTKGANEGSHFDSWNFQMSESPGSAHRGRPWWTTLTGTLQCYQLNCIEWLLEFVGISWFGASLVEHNWRAFKSRTYNIISFCILTVLSAQFVQFEIAFSASTWWLCMFILHAGRQCYVASMCKNPCWEWSFK